MFISKNAAPFKVSNPDSIEVKWFYTKNWKWISERKKPVLNFDIGGVRVMVAIWSCIFSRPFLGGVGASSRSEFSKNPRQTYAIIKYTGSLEVFKKSPVNRKNIVNKYVFKSGFLAEGWNYSPLSSFLAFLNLRILIYMSIFANYAVFNNH